MGKSLWRLDWRSDARLQSARPATPLHLYRHLLRESSYLPPYARPFFDGRIKTRFRNHAHSADVKTPLRQGHHALRYFRAALLGDRARMLRLVHMAFGRVGERRRMLLNHLTMPDAPAGTTSLEDYIKEAQARTDRGPDWLDKWNLDRLTVFARSQARQTFKASPRPELLTKQLDMEQHTTGTTIWGEPICPKLARSRLRKAWANVATRILPPVPKSEWELLRDLSRGCAPASVWMPPPRRRLEPRLTSVEVGLEKKIWRWQSYASLPLEDVEKVNKRWSKMLSGDEGTGTPADPYPLGRHR